MGSLWDTLSFSLTNLGIPLGTSLLRPWIRRLSKTYFPTLNMKSVLCRLTAKELPTSATSFPCAPKKLVILNFLSLFHLLGGKGNTSIPSNRRLSHGGHIESRGTENLLRPLHSFPYLSSPDSGYEICNL